MDEDKVVTPMNLATLTPTIGLNGQKSKESVLKFCHVRVGVRVGVCVDDRGNVAAMSVGFETM